MDTDSPMWTWDELVAALPGVTPMVSDGAPSAITGIAFDSRQVQPGDLFVALPGDPGPRFRVSSRSDRDGHDYIPAAIANGAVATLSHDGQPRQVPQLMVADTLDALWALARNRRQHLQGRVVAITGSSGKTTCKTLLAAALRAHASSGSFNNHLGVPLSIATADPAVDFAVFEIGTNHPGEIAPLSQLARPDVAVLLNVHRAHVANFASEAALRAEKLSIVDGLVPGGTLVVEDQVLDVPNKHDVIRFGRSANAQVRLRKIEGDRALYDVFGREFTAHVPRGGEHRALSLAAVLAVLSALDQPLELAADLPDELIPAGRGNIHSFAGLDIVDDSYNANPSSMRASLVSFGEAPVKVPGQGRRFAVLGQMLELGESGPGAHADLADCCEKLDGLWLVGEGMQALQRQLVQNLGEAVAAKMLGGYWADAADPTLLESLLETLAPGDRLLAKGSNGTLWQAELVPRLLSRLELKFGAKK